MLQITIVGKIVHVEEQQLMTLYTVDDGTGRVLAKYWTPNDDDDYVRPPNTDGVRTHPRECRMSYIASLITRCQMP